MANGLTVRFSADASQYLAATGKVESSTKKMTSGLETTAGRTEFALGKLVGRAAGMQSAFEPLAQFAPAMGSIGVAAGPVAIAVGAVALGFSELSAATERSIQISNDRIKKFDEETAALLRISSGATTYSEESSRGLVEFQKSMRDEAVKKYADSWQKFFDTLKGGSNDYQFQIQNLNETIRAAEENAAAVKKIEDAHRAEAKAIEAANAERKKTLETMQAEYKMVEVMVNGQKKMVMASGKAFGGEPLSDMAEAERQIRNMQESLGDMSANEKTQFDAWAAQKRLEAETKVNRDIFADQQKLNEQLAKEKADAEKKAMQDAEKKAAATKKENEQLQAAGIDQQSARFSDSLAKTGIIIGGTTQGLDVQKEQLTTLKEIKKNTAKNSQTMKLG